MVNEYGSAIMILARAIFSGIPFKAIQYFNIRQHLSAELPKPHLLSLPLSLHLLLILLLDRELTREQTPAVGGRPHLLHLVEFAQDIVQSCVVVVVRFLTLVRKTGTIESQGPNFSLKRKSWNISGFPETDIYHKFMKVNLHPKIFVDI